MQARRRTKEQIEREWDRCDRRLDQILGEIRRDREYAHKRAARAGTQLEEISKDGERRERAYADLARFHDGLLRRFEISFRESSEMMASALRDLRSELGDLREASQAHTQAILKLMDRIDRWGPPGPAAA
ncbi:MAG: hypothetical protein QOJ38_1909 [Solirubrobacterales bacterium]|jgi:hypothetical protein|nr:hypothetical protein [Solirubrobacterales bacterium]